MVNNDLLGVINRLAGRKRRREEEEEEEEEKKKKEKRKNMEMPGDITDEKHAPSSVTKPLPQPCSIQSPDEESTVSSWIEEIEKVLMKDDNFDHRVETLMMIS
ncbi:bZIP transcription factor 60-like protein [Gossypium australe]|uniref:BZIP transcription factor 60-like protein n=1 Tax=Gossypium australe TaxID=47621 RepID=A0A5B6VIB5_9ROSI|nr:bZIP transcription factor 60-like protein [Gossypium australe]